LHQDLSRAARARGGEGEFPHLPGPLGECNGLLQSLGRSG
jgi:hypothetical protein